MPEDKPTNPYSPPTSISESPTPGPRHSTVPAQLVSVATVVYIVFMFMNLSSSSVDLKAGRLLLLNAPVLLMWSGILLATLRFGLHLGTVAIGMQCLIMLIMLAQGIGSPEIVIMINGLMIGIMAILTAVCHRFAQRNRT